LLCNTIAPVVRVGASDLQKTAQSTFIPANASEIAKDLRQHIKCVRAARLPWPCDVARFPFDLATRKAYARAESAKAFSTWWSFESPHLFAHFAFVRDLVANQPAG
jgi:hypothetical protein